MRSTGRFTLASLLTCMLIGGCDGRGGSSGLDVSGENGAITQALARRQCLAFQQLTICPAGEAAAGSPSIDTPLAGATVIDCVQSAPDGACTVTLRFTPRAFPSNTTFKVLAREDASNNPWVLGTDPVVENNAGASSYAATVSLISTHGGPPAQVQMAVLAFVGSVSSPPTQVSQLHQTAATFAFVTPALAVNVVVGNGDPSTCTEDVLAAALAGGSVTFDCGSAPVTITVTHNNVIQHDTTIDGGNLVTIQGRDNPGLQVFYVQHGTTLQLSNLVVSAGESVESAQPPGAGNNTAIYNDAGTVRVRNTTFADTVSGSGGAIYNSGDKGAAVVTIASSTFVDNNSVDGGSPLYNAGGSVSVSNSTFTRNRSARGGMIFNVRGTVTLTNSTVADNSSGSGAVDNLGGTVTLRNTILANNTGGNCGGTITDGGHNLRWPSTDASCVGSFGDPHLGLLAGNGGPTQTLALAAGSAAIGAGDDSICAAAPVSGVDQRGFVRPGAGQASCSIGAYEYNSGSPCGAGFCVFPEVCVDAACVVATPTATSPPTLTPTPVATVTPTATVPPFTAHVVGNGDPGSCTEDALAAAVAQGGSVTFDCGPNPVTVTVAHNTLIQFDTAIDGGNRVTLSGGTTPGVQLFYVQHGVTLQLSNAVVSGGDGTVNARPPGAGNNTAIYNDAGTVRVRNTTFADTVSGSGGAIYNSGDKGAAVVTISNSTFTDNRSVDSGSPIYNVGGSVSLTNSTFTGNSSARGGTIVNARGGTLTLTNSTVADNSSGSGGAIDNLESAVTLKNTIVANNAGGNCGGTITDGGHNLRWPSTDASCVGVFGDPQLGLLAGNGGPTQTRAVGAGSAAIGAGDNTICATAPVGGVDQRGFVRPGAGQASCSIGAYEYNSGTTCGSDFCVFPEVCVDQACVVATPTATPSPTGTPTPPTEPTATNTPGAADCCQCPASCAAPVDGACEIGCTVVFGTSCFGGQLCVALTPTP